MEQLRPEIALSWRRVSLSGLGTAAAVSTVDEGAVDPASRLLIAARPVLADLAERLDGASNCIILADRNARLVVPPSGDQKLRSRLAGVGTVPGQRFAEETTGTNSIATAHELRAGIAVRGEEHYLEPFKAFSCYGHPIRNPLNRRLEGVLDITCLSRDDSPLLAPFLLRAVSDIEERLVTTARLSQQRMLAEFQMATAGHHRPVLVLGKGVQLANPAAAELLDPADHAWLRQLASDLRVDDSERSATVRLTSGRDTAVRFRPVGPNAEGALFEFAEPVVEARSRSAARASDRTAYVGGAPGTGRSTAAREFASGREIVVLEAGQCPDLAHAAPPPCAVVLVEDVHLLSEAGRARVRVLLDDPERAVVLCGLPRAELAAGAAALAARCHRHVELAPLRERAEEIPGLVRSMLGELGLRERLRFTPTALQHLSTHPWPGNVRELRWVVQEVVRHRSAGDITPADLPEGYRSGPRVRRMTPLERAEHDAILAALRECGGNKVHAAKRLGISRTTLYSRVRALQIVP